MQIRDERSKVGAGQVAATRMRGAFRHQTLPVTRHCLSPDIARHQTLIVIVIVPSPSPEQI